MTINDASLPKMNRLQLDDSYNQHLERPNISQITLTEEPHGLGNETETVTKTNPTYSEEDIFNESNVEKDW